MGTPKQGNGRGAAERQVDGGDGRYGIIGEHPTMQAVLRLIVRLSKRQTSVIICGETGTGKELLARALHRASPGCDGPFEALNCAAIPPEIAESELFGHERGAFTGATRDYYGAFDRARGGTLFLDEIGEMHVGLQAKLLRVLDGGGYRPVGGDRTRGVQARVVAATNRDLQREAEQGRFRLDLYHRLAVGVIRVPPLRRRPEDIPLIVDHFLRQIGDQTGSRHTLAANVMSLLQSQPWPGNVRELRNVVERAATTGGELIGTRDFEFDDAWRASDVSPGMVCIEGRSFAELRREVYVRMIQRHGGNRSAAAAALDIPKSTFFDHLRGMKIAEV